MTEELPVPVRVQAKTGVWSVDSFPMILIPRHYWAAVMEVMEARFGVEAAADVYFEATYQSAYRWCEEEALTHALSGVDVFRHYMRRMSDRGWGQFRVLTIEPATGAARIRLDHSAIALARPDAGRDVCHSFNGAFCGAMDYVAAAAGRPVPDQTMPRSRETACAANGAPHCLFEVAPRED